MGSRTLRAVGFGSILLLVAAVSAGFESLAAPAARQSPRSAFDTDEAAFESLGEDLFVNMNNVSYTLDGDGVFDIYFACSSFRGTDPLRFVDPRKIRDLRSYFGDEKRYGKHFVQANRYHINPRNIAFIETHDNFVVINFNSRVMDSFAQLRLSGADAEAFRKKR